VLAVRLAITACGALVASCGDNKMPLPAAPDVPRPNFATVTSDRWRALAGERVYFGHQSVGGNIVDGIASVLADHPGIPLRVVEAAALDSAGAPGIYHGLIGTNGDPAGKTAAFGAIVDRGAPGVGILKYCYVDVDARSNPDSLFASYQRAMMSLRARHPALNIVHVTMPLTTVGGWKEVVMGKLRGRTTTRDLNVTRNRYNALLRLAYAGKEPVFDLARFESTHSDGSRAFFMRKGDTVFTLAPEYTDDGGHLNAAARRAAAMEFLAVLAGL
jgi:hypothetical protein